MEKQIEQILPVPEPVVVTTETIPVVPLVVIGTVVFAAICSNIYNLTSKK
jgi:hypothetical protein